jgi:hypothetical protein
MTVTFLKNLEHKNSGEHHLEFSKKDFLQEKEKSFQEGYDLAQKEMGVQGREILQNIMNEWLEHEKNRKQEWINFYEKFYEYVGDLCRYILKESFPKVAQEYGEDIVLHLLKDMMKRWEKPEEETLIMDIHPSLYPIVQEFFKHQNNIWHIEKWEDQNHHLNCRIRTENGGVIFEWDKWIQDLEGSLHATFDAVTVENSTQHPTSYSKGE